MVRRQAAAERRVVGEQIAAASEDLAEGRLPGDCLLRLVAGPSMAEAATPERPARVVELSAGQEAEFTAQGCVGRLPIFLTGQTEQRARNVLEVGDQTVYVEDADFTLFLPLVLGLYERWRQGG
jgi:hypothetical protein